MRRKESLSRRILSSLVSGLLVAGCAGPAGKGPEGLSKRPLPDSTYVYGYAEIGVCQLFEIRFEDASNSKHAYYTRQWADNGISKDDLFAVALAPGKWVVKYIEAGNGCHSGGFRYDIGRSLEVETGKGNYLGRFNGKEDPLPRLTADSATRAGEKSIVDGYMTEIYAGFEAGKTVFRRLEK